MGSDLLTVMTSLGHPHFSILAHDRGARVAHQLAINHPEAIKKLMLLDILPTLTMYEHGKYTWYQKYWHWPFLSQPFPFPEKAILSNPALFAEKFLGKAGVGKGFIFNEEVRAVYERTLEDENCVHAMCEDYRAGVTIDLEEQRRDREAGRKIQCDVFVVWGGKGAIESEFGDVLGLWREVCEGKVEGCAVDGGHYVPEECSEELVELVKKWF
ncbi:26c627c7-87c9-4e76-9d2d-208f3b4950b2 [Sclerotinia trifoliorum]|uniref:26c627c7-87c9-4e76-9d2d-208f3b4950b2 n=1 Tax=Sclerotinia trifoliorum TaxID=28548 RepID=A0A8H2VZ96_9HELO|nr:26c627c7-87c9-4e76-9d2d-208f3b4950b2 [Sclerotinia trifoliorum]